MIRALRFLVRNWPLKVAAVLLSTLLYAGLVLSQNSQTWAGQVPIQVLNQPTDAVLVSTLPAVSDIRYFAPGDIASRLSSNSFTATIDLAGAKFSGSNPYVVVNVQVSSIVQGVQVIDWNPQVIQIQLDPLIRKTVPVVVDHGTVPAGLQVGTPALSATQVTAIGPESVVRRVIEAEAQVRIQPPGLDVDQEVDLVGIDAKGEVVSPVEFNPRSVHVRIQVGTELTTRPLPVNPMVTGTPGAGYQVASVSVDPPSVSVSGDANALAPLVTIDTAAVSISGASGTVTQTVGLELPAGVTVVGNATVTVRIQLRAVTGTQDLTVAIVPDGARSDRTYAFSTSTVTVTLGGTLAALDALDPTTFVATADVSTLDPGSHQVQLLVTVPAGLNLVAINPGTVTVTVGASATPLPSPSPSASPGAL